MIKLLDILREGKGILSIFDFDDTLVKSDSWVYIKKPDGKEIKLDAAEFAMHKGLEKGEEYDFRDFDRKIRSPKLIKKNVDLLRKQLKKGGRKVTILTARRLGAPINSFFKTIGRGIWSEYLRMIDRSCQPFNKSSSPSRKCRIISVPRSTFLTTSNE